MPIIIHIMIAIVFSVISQLLIKAGLNTLGNINLSQGFTSFYLKIFLSPWVIMGIVAYTIAGFFWLYSLTKVDLSFAYPFLALSYVMILLFSRVFFYESVSLLRWAGVLVICLGVILVSRS